MTKTVRGLCAMMALLALGFGIAAFTTAAPAAAVACPPHKGGGLTKIFCGGIAGIPCPGNLVCVDDPRDDCCPQNGGADCSGLCARRR